jgi:Ti-type conjugative transfer relaxase TraA
MLLRNIARQGSPPLHPQTPTEEIMALYHLSAKTISRSKGQSAIASASYRSEQKLKDERLGKTFDYTRKGATVHSEIMSPESVPSWTHDREKLWNHVEAAEKRKDAQLSREIEIALPTELELNEHIALVRQFVKENFVDAGMVADINMHYRSGNPHAHIMLTTRSIDENGFGLKNTAWNAKAELMAWRKNWADTANLYLARAGFDLRIDHRSYAERGIDLEPQNKIGTGFHRRNASALERFQEHQRIARENGERIIQDSHIALDYITRHQSVFGAYDIYRLANTHSADAEQFKKVSEAIFANEDLVKLGQDERGKDRFTTRQVLEAERAMLENAQALATQPAHQVNARYIDQAKATRTLTPDQTKALEHVCTSGDICCVIGYAGSGKSYTLGAVREAFEAQGYRVQGAALAGIAAEGLQRESGIASRTIARCLMDIENGKGLSSRDVLIIDEAGMVATRQMHRLIDYAHQQGAKVVLVGDGQQLQPIEAGGAFRGIYARLGGAQLTEIRRQSRDWQKTCTRQLEGPQAAEALETYRSKGRFYEHTTQDQAAGKLVDQWQDFRRDNPKASSIMTAYRNADVDRLNQKGRAAAKQMGWLSGKERVLEAAKGDLTLMKGDRVMFLKNNAVLDVRNGNLGTVERIRRQVLQVRLDNGRQCAFDIQQYPHLTHGYAATVHKLQGATVDRSFVLADQYFDRHAALTALTRHRDDVCVHWSREQFDGFNQLKQALTRERPKALAVDFCTDRAVEPRLSLAMAQQRMQPIIEEGKHERDRSGGVDRHPDRPLGRGHGGLGRRRTADLEPGSGPDREPGQGVGRTTTHDGRAMGRGGSDVEGSVSGRGQGHQGHDMESVADDAARGAHRWSRSAYRIYARAAPLRAREKSDGLLAMVHRQTSGIETGRSKDLGPDLRASKRKVTDRTTPEVKRHLKAMGCKRYEVAVRDMKQQKITQANTWTEKQVLEAVPMLRRLNVRGNEIYIRPANKDEAHGLILASAVDKATLDGFRRDGLDPALVVRIGPYQHQAWIKLSEGGQPAPSEAQKSIIADRITEKYEKYGFAEKQVGTGLYGHLAGFALQRDESKKDMSICTVDHDSGKVASKAALMLSQADQMLEQQQAREKQRLQERYSGEYFNARVELPDGRSFEKTLRVEPSHGPEQKRTMLKKEAGDFVCRTLNRMYVPSDQFHKVSCTVSPATPEQIRSFERERARSRAMDRGPIIGM